MAIVGVDSGAQPIVNKEKTLILTVNGEIYNYKKLKQNELKDCQFVTYSDCEVIMHLYKTFGRDFIHRLDGIFTFVLYDASKNYYMVARDAIGVNTLYYGYNAAKPKTLYFASEMKCLNDICDCIMSFPPGHIYDSAAGFIQWYNPIWYNESLVPKNPVDYSLIRNLLTEAVKKRLMSEVPYGVLLSGGLDSSIIASIAARVTKTIVQHQLTDGMNGTTVNGNHFHNANDSVENLAFWPRLHSFSIGLNDEY